MDITTILIICLILFLVVCESRGYVKKEKKVEEYFYNKKSKNFCNFKPVGDKPPIPSPYQCVLDFGCSQGQPSDKYGDVCKSCTGKNYPANEVMARDVGRVRQMSKLW